MQAVPKNFPRCWCSSRRASRPPSSVHAARCRRWGSTGYWSGCSRCWGQCRRWCRRCVPSRPAVRPARQSRSLPQSGRGPAAGWGSALSRAQWVVVLGSLRRASRRLARWGLPRAALSELAWSLSGQRSAAAALRSGFLPAGFLPAGRVLPAGFLPARVPPAGFLPARKWLGSPPTERLRSRQQGRSGPAQPPNRRSGSACRRPRGWRARRVSACASLPAVSGWRSGSLLPAGHPGRQKTASPPLSKQKTPPAGWSSTPALCGFWATRPPGRKMT